MGGASASRVACWFSFCPCGTPVPMWGSSAHVGHWCTCGVPRLHVWRAGSVFAHVGLQCPCGAPVPMWDTGARVGCLGFTCGVLVQFLPMWDSSAHVGLQCPCGTLPFLEELRYQEEVIIKLNQNFGARVGCLGFTCGVLVQFYNNF